MKYALLNYASPEIRDVPEDQLGSVVAEYEAILDEPGVLNGMRLQGAEAATTEAFAVATERWPRDGTPPNPGAWLTITARNRAIDRIRRAATLAEKTKLLEAQETVEATMEGPDAEGTSFPDERLELIFTR